MTLIAIRTKEDLDNIINEYGVNYQDLEGDSFLHQFARSGQTQLIIYLLDRNQKEKFEINIKNKLGRTALFDALNEEIVEILLLHKIDYNCKDNDGKIAEQVNSCVKYVINQRCNNTKKRILKNLYR